MLSIDINDAMLSRLLALDPPVTEVGKITVAGCNQGRHERRIFQAPGRILRIEDDKGAKLASVSGVAFVLKNASEGCGGIGGTAQPAAQLGA